MDALSKTRRFSVAGTASEGLCIFEERISAIKGGNIAKAPPEDGGAPSNQLHSPDPRHLHKLSLLRLLFVYRATYPILSPYISTLAAIIYSCLSNDTDDYFHAESDTFWILGELSQEFEDIAAKDGIHTWMHDLSARLVQLDPELAERLVRA